MIIWIWFLRVLIRVLRKYVVFWRVWMCCKVILLVILIRFMIWYRRCWVILLIRLRVVSRRVRMDWVVKVMWMVRVVWLWLVRWWWVFWYWWVRCGLVLVFDGMCVSVRLVINVINGCLWVVVFYLFLVMLLSYLMVLWKLFFFIWILDVLNIRVWMIRERILVLKNKSYVFGLLENWNFGLKIRKSWIVLILFWIMLSNFIILVLMLLG